MKSSAYASSALSMAAVDMPLVDRTPRFFGSATERLARPTNGGLGIRFTGFGDDASRVSVGQLGGGRSMGEKAGV